MTQTIRPGPNSRQNVRRSYTQAQLQYSLAFPEIYSLLHAYSCYNNRLTLGDYKSDIALVGVLYNYPSLYHEETTTKTHTYIPV